MNEEPGHPIGWDFILPDGLSLAMTDCTLWAVSIQWEAFYNSLKENGGGPRAGKGMLSHIGVYKHHGEKDEDVKEAGSGGWRGWGGDGGWLRDWAKGGPWGDEEEERIKIIAELDHQSIAIYCKKNDNYNIQLN